MSQEKTQEKQAPDINRCSFCGLPQDQVERLIGGPHGVFICNECIELCNMVIREGREQQTQASNQKMPAKICAITPQSSQTPQC